MSRSYEMTVEIENFNAGKKVAIVTAANEEWDFEDWHQVDIPLMATGTGNLCAGMSEEEFTERLSKAIWKANGGYCRVLVRATYLDAVPYEEHSLGEEDYENAVANGEMDDEED